MNELARLEVEERNGICLIQLHGEVDMSNAAELGAQMEAAVRNGGLGLVIDLSHTTYLDSAGVRLLFLLAGRLSSRRQEMRLVVPEDSPVRAVLELTRLATVVPFESRLDTALEESGSEAPRSTE
jgi:anti-anti-sigma factor